PLYWSANRWVSASAFSFFFQAEDGIRDFHVTGVQTCALPIFCGDRQQGKVVETGKFAIGRRAENGTHRQVIVGHKLLGALLRSDLFAAMTAPDLVAETFTEQTRKSQCIIFFAADKLVIKRDAPGL